MCTSTRHKYLLNFYEHARVQTRGRDLGTSMVSRSQVLPLGLAASWARRTRPAHTGHAISPHNIPGRNSSHSKDMESHAEGHKGQVAGNTGEAV